MLLTPSFQIVCSLPRLPCFNAYCFTGCSASADLSKCAAFCDSCCSCRGCCSHTVGGHSLGFLKPSSSCLFVYFVCYSHGFGYIAIDTANGCIFSWIRSGVGSARSYVQGTLRALGKHRSWMLCEDPVSNSFEVFVCIPKIASQGRFVGVISITYYGYILRDAFGFPFRIDIGTNISIRAAQDEESTSSWFGQLLARWLSSVRQAL